MNRKHVIDDTIPKIAPNIKAIFDFVGPERSMDIFNLRVIFVLEKDLCLLISIKRKQIFFSR